uniref:AlNc14C202G8730 protein n=1 Tax=Albugo laibachii Nc14 TaxID=890382 RepID=F0WQS0_9STRA|nr:AlNc14C202G8730 [Albugo laibachii Nc14]CCA25340.1 AlNc14C291G10246 [Albugo laibachii Nc14]|eukprot:CCA25340.1 AlNc14C291G10246 [Albugo laibachii Nc14]
MDLQKDTKDVKFAFSSSPESIRYQSLSSNFGFWRVKSYCTTKSHCEQLELLTLVNVVAGLWSPHPNSFQTIQPGRKRVCLLTWIPSDLRFSDPKACRNAYDKKAIHVVLWN